MAHPLLLFQRPCLLWTQWRFRLLIVINHVAREEMSSSKALRHKNWLDVFFITALMKFF